MNGQHRDRSAAADVAVTVVELLTGALTADQQLGDVDRAETIAITQAMARLLLGTPLRSDGKLTVKSLAAEAGLRRNKLTHKHTGLKDLFYALVNTHNTPPAIAVDLRNETTSSTRPWPSYARPTANVRFLRAPARDARAGPPPTRA